MCAYVTTKTANEKLDAPLHCGLMSHCFPKTKKENRVLHLMLPVVCVNIHSMFALFKLAIFTQAKILI